MMRQAAYAGSVYVTPAATALLPSLLLTHSSQADADLGMGPGLCRYEELQLIYQAARLRRAWRVSRGCIDIDLPEAKLEVAQGQLDAAAPAVTCTKLSQVGWGMQRVAARGTCTQDLQRCAMPQAKGITQAGLWGHGTVSVEQQVAVWCWRWGSSSW